MTNEQPVSGFGRNPALMFSLAANAILFIAACAALVAYIEASRERDSQKMVAALATQDADAKKTAIALLTKELDETKTKLVDQTAKAAAAQLVISQIPVRIEFRKSRLGRGLVGVFSNMSAKQLPVIVEVRNPTTSQSTEFSIQIASGSHTELGHLEGWQFASGDQVKLRSAGYEPIEAIAP